MTSGNIYEYAERPKASPHTSTASTILHLGLSTTMYEVFIYFMSTHIVASYEKFE